MNTQITFGKYQGYTPAQLRRIDSNYLAWGAQNLRSEFWRKQFSQALQGITRDEQIAEMCHWDNISPEEADAQLRHIAAIEATDDAAWDAEQAKINAVAEKWAAIIGKSIRETRSVMDRYCGDWAELPASKFSSPEAHRNFCAMMKEYDVLFS